MARKESKGLLSPEIAAGELFTECLAKHELPTRLTPAVFAEAIAYPSHYPVAFELLKLFGKSDKTTYFTEWNGNHLPNEKVPMTKSKYQSEVSARKKDIKLPLKHAHSQRLQMLCVAHSSNWEPDGQQLYYMMSEVVGPQLGYKFDVPNNQFHQPGDFHLIVKWMSQHLKELAPLYIDKGDLTTASAQIAQGRGVEIDKSATDNLLGAWEETVGPVNLGAVIAKEGKVVDPTRDRLPRAGADNVTRRFEDLFVNLNLGDAEAVAKFFGIAKLDAKNLAVFSRQINVLQLMMLDLVKDERTGYMPKQKLSSMVGLDVSYISSSLREVAAQSPRADRKKALNSMDPKLGNRTLRVCIDHLIQTGNKLNGPGFNAARAILVKYTSMKLAGDAQAETLEKLMYEFNQLATDPGAKDRLKLDELMT